MKHLLLILFLLSGLYAKASHLAGGELTYKYISGKTYDIEVTIYRDCNDCKLSGTGGGSSTQNCNDLDEVFVRTISTTCGNKKIGAIALTKVGYKNITQLCTSAKSKCDNNPNYNYGFEAHYYKGRINFDDYSEYTGCMIQLFFHKSERSSSITNLNTEEDDLYNFALINPWVASANSPQFEEDPKIIYNAYQPTYISDGVVSTDGDSFAYKWGIPFSNYNSSISYKSNFNPSNFISTYCPSGVNCTPNPSTSIPQGLFLDDKTGLIVCTPTGNNETSTRVLEVEQWRNINGTPTMIGKVRRDVLCVITSQNENNPPIITAEDSYKICAGDIFDLDIDIADIPYNLGTSSRNQDSVEINVKSNLALLKINKSATSTAPYQKVNLSFASSLSDAGTYWIQIKANDNFCPEIATSFKRIRLEIISPPTLSAILSDEFCGNNSIKLSSNRQGVFDASVRNDSNILVFDTKSFPSTSIEKFHYDKNENLNYIFSVRDNFGCSTTLDTAIINIGKSNVPRASINGPSEICDNAELFLNIRHSNLEIGTVKWIKNESIISTSAELNTNAFDGLLHLEYALLRNELACNFTDSIRIKSLRSTPITYNEKSSICYSDAFDLDQLSISPGTGNWTSNLPIALNLVSLNSLGNRDTSFSIQYTFTNSLGCTSKLAKDVKVSQAPILKLSNEAVCGDNFEYRLKNAIELPFNPSVENISWNVLNKPQALKLSPFPALDIPNHGIGIYIIEAVNTFSNGCITRDTGTVTVDKGLKLSTNNLNTICQQGEAVNLEDYLNLNATNGGWSSLSAGDLLHTKNFTPSKCGTFDFSYTYDKNGCYDKLQLELEVVCRPAFDITLPNAICENYPAIELPQVGRWQGLGVSGNQFSPNGLVGWQYLRNEQVVNACIFDTFIPIEIREPLAIEIGKLPSQLCEGEELTFDLAANHINEIHAIGCSGNVLLVDNKAHYRASLCDLQNGEISLSISQITSALCAAVKENIRIPYYPLPAVRLEESVKACWPYSISETISLDNDVFVSSYTILSKNHTFSGTGNTLIYTFPTSGNYDIEIKSETSKGCASTQLFQNQYILFPKPEASFSVGEKSHLSLSERDIYLSNASTLSQGALNYAWYWTKNTETSLFSSLQNPLFTLPADTGKFTISLVANTEKGCSDTTFENIWVVPDILVFIPNAFTPDEKGPTENATFNIISSNVQSFHIQIYNKWGQMVFESFDISKSWDGTFGAKNCQTGVYVYSIKILNKSGIPYDYQGIVNLVR